jgi:pilus assembly protein CpaC
VASPLLKQGQMKFPITSLLFISQIAEAEIISIGESLILNKTSSQIWVEKNECFLADIKKQIVITGKKRCSAKIKIGKDILTLQVVTSAQLKLFSELENYFKNTPGLKVEFDSSQIVVSGLIYDWKTWTQIRKLNADNSEFIMNTKVSQELKKQLQGFIDTELKQLGLLSVQVRIEPHLQVGMSPDQKNKKDYALYFRKLGIPFNVDKEYLKTEPTVKVKIKILEISKSSSQHLGIQFPSSIDYRLLPQKLQGIDSLSATLSALEANGEVKTLASPNLVGRSGEEAQFYAGGDFPIRLKGHRAENIQWIKYGVGMKIRPKADSYGRINLSIETEVSNLAAIVDGLPQVERSHVISHFDLAKSQMVALSGILRNQTHSNREGLPFLSRIPLLGTLFSSQKFLNHESELVILVEPELMVN